MKTPQNTETSEKTVENFQETADPLQTFITLDNYRIVNHGSNRDLILFSVPKETKLTYRPKQKIIQIKPVNLGDCRTCVKRNCRVLPWCLQNQNQVCPLSGEKASIIKTAEVDYHYRHNLIIKPRRNLYIGINIYCLEPEDFGQKIVCDLEVVNKILPDGKTYNLINLFKHCNGRSDLESAKYIFTIKPKKRFVKNKGYELKLNGNTVYLRYEEIRKN